MIRNALPYLRKHLHFSLGVAFLAFTVLTIAFGIWWQWPVQLDRVPPELGEVVAGKTYSCVHSYIQLALWVEEGTTQPGNGEASDPFAQTRFARHVFAHTGKCWARRSGFSEWVLDGSAEVFTSENQLVIRADYAKGRLHGEFTSWFTTGEVRETGRYWQGSKDGEWRLRSSSDGFIESLERYDRGKKVGTWIKSERQEYGGRQFVNATYEYYQDGKLRRRESNRPRSRFPWQVTEFDEHEKRLNESLWNHDRSVRLGIDHYRADLRHGSWERLVKEGDNTLQHRGQWQDGLPDGEWIYERSGGPPDRLAFRQGALVEFNHKPVCDVLMLRLSHDEDDEYRRSELLKVDDRNYALSERKQVFRWIYGATWATPRVDPRLECTPNEFFEAWNEKLPSDFEFDNLPASAALCLMLDDANLTLDYRFGTFWITSPNLARTWKDETGTNPWFAAITNTPWEWTKDADGISHVVNSPYCQRDRHFGKDWQPEWDANRRLELLVPITCKLGTARRIDGTKCNISSRLQVPSDALGYASTQPEYLSFDEVITLECEANQCRLELRGETLFMVPRNPIMAPRNPPKLSRSAR